MNTHTHMSMCIETIQISHVYICMYIMFIIRFAPKQILNICTHRFMAPAQISSPDGSPQTVLHPGESSAFHPVSSVRVVSYFESQDTAFFGGVVDEFFSSSTLPSSPVENTTHINFSSEANKRLTPTAPCLKYRCTAQTPQTRTAHTHTHTPTLSLSATISHIRHRPNMHQVPQHNYLMLCVTNIDIYIYICICKYIYTHICMYVHMCIYVRVCICLCLRICTYMYVYIYGYPTYAPVRFCCTPCRN